MNRTVPVVLALLLTSAPLFASAASPAAAPAAPAEAEPHDHPMRGALFGEMTPVALAGDDRLVRVDYQYRVAAPHGAGRFSVEAPPGVTLHAGALPDEAFGGVGASAPAGDHKDAGAAHPEPGSTLRRGSFVVRASGDGPFELRATLQADDGAGRRQSLHVQRAFHYDASGALRLGLPGGQGFRSAASVLVENDGSAAASEGFGDAWTADAPTVAQESTSACTVTFSVYHKMPSSHPSYNSNSWGKMITGLRVTILNSGGSTIAGPVYADATGRATFTVTTDPCNTSFKFRAHTSFADGGASKVSTSDLANNAYEMTTTASRPVQTNDVWTLTLPGETYADGFWVHSRAVLGYWRAAKEKAVDENVQVHMTPGAKRDDMFADRCTTCYEPSNAIEPAEIWIDGTLGFQYDPWTVEHEYGHHVHTRVAGAFNAPSYGVHKDCATECHHWDSMHNTMPSAFMEAWANFFAAVVQNNPDLTSFDVDNPDAKGKSDHSGLACRGPYRECSVAGAMWDTYVSNGKNFHPFMDVLSKNPQGVHGFRSTWQSTGKSHLSSLESHMGAHGIAPLGDAGKGGDAPNSGGLSISPARGLRGDLSSESHQASVDKSDFYSVYASAGEIVRGWAWGEQGQDVDVYLYDPSGNVIDSSARAGNNGDGVDKVASVSGTYRVEVRNFGGAQGTYRMDVTAGRPSWSQEAESFPTKSTGGTQYHAPASGSYEHNIWADGHVATTTNTLPLGYAKLDVVARGDPAGGVWPVMRVYVDNVLQIEQSVFTSTLRTYTEYVYLPTTGAHAVKVEFTNDGIVGAEDRNLRVDVVRLTAVDDSWDREAESFGTKTTGGESTGGAPSGGKAWNLWSNGHVEHTVWTDWDGTHEVSILARGSPAGGVWPKMKVTLGTTVILDTHVTTTDFRTYVATTQGLTPGTYALRIEFTNDDTIGAEDRNLFVDRAWLWDRP